VRYIRRRRLEMARPEIALLWLLLFIASAGSALGIKLKIRPGGTECLHESIGPEHFTSGSGVSRSQDVPCMCGCLERGHMALRH